MVCAVGCTIRANDDDYDDPMELPGDATRTLAGEGFVRRDHDLGQISNDSGTGFVEDTFTSLQFFTVPSVPDCDAYYNAPIALLWTWTSTDPERPRRAGSLRRQRGSGHRPGAG